MVLLHLIRETLPANKMGCHSYPLPIIFYRHPFFAFKNEFADSVIRGWGLETYDYLPVASGVKFNDERLELVARYRFGEEGAIDIPMNTEEPLARRDFICGLNHWILRPKAAETIFPWQTLFIGHKSADIDPFDGAVPLRCDHAEIGGSNLIFPLRWWTDNDVWDYIERNAVPHDQRRYRNRAEVSDTWLNPDYIRACTACIDPRVKAAEVYCPKLGKNVQNFGKHVLRLQHIPSYVEQESEEEGNLCQIQE